jgi:hypothetical protein
MVIRCFSIYDFLVRRTKSPSQHVHSRLPAKGFAKLIIQDMPDEDRTQGYVCSVGITDGERAVGRIRCCADH